MAVESERRRRWLFLRPDVWPFPIVITETDGMDEAGQNSGEADKVSQLIARTRAFGNRARIYMECTVSTESGRTWQEYTGGTESHIVMPCPRCNAWVCPEREHLVGWQESHSQVEARQSAHFCCPACNEPWSDSERVDANRNSKVVHRGQTITEAGEVEGELPSTDTLGFRWSAVNNLFVTAGDIAADEWRAARAADEDNAEHTDYKCRSDDSVPGNASGPSSVCKAYDG
ncbi:MAG: phage terminase large subunit family protein [Pirellulaceae bacterium]|nr:phage terminase large subunit family protein [Pirellulaceae bacterium]